MTDPASDELCDCEPDPAGVELYNGWTLVAPPGTSRAATEYAARRLYDDDYLPSPDDAEAAAEDEARRAERDAIGPLHGPPTEHQHLLNELLIETLNRTMRSTTPLTDFMFRPPAKAQKFGTVVFETTNPGGPSPVKDRFMPADTWIDGYDHTLDWDPWDVPATDWSVHGPIYDELTRWGRRALDDDTVALTAQWAAQPPARPGWHGSITGPPRPTPLKPTPWQTLPKGIHDGNRTVIIDEGAEPAPHDPGPAHRTRPAPVPWDSPLADPVADMKRAIGETP